MTDKLKPCPFCGRTPKVLDNGASVAYVSCRCGFDIFFFRKGRTIGFGKRGVNNVIKRWNTRKEERKNGNG